MALSRAAGTERKVVLGHPMANVHRQTAGEAHARGPDAAAAVQAADGGSVDVAKSESGRDDGGDGDGENADGGGVSFWSVSSDTGPRWATCNTSVVCIHGVITYIVINGAGNAGSIVAAFGNGADTLIPSDDRGQGSDRRGGVVGGRRLPLGIRCAENEVTGDDNRVALAEVSFQGRATRWSDQDTARIGLNRDGLAIAFGLNAAASSRPRLDRASGAGSGVVLGLPPAGPTPDSRCPDSGCGFWPGTRGARRYHAARRPQQAVGNWGRRGAGSLDNRGCKKDKWSDL